MTMEFVSVIKVAKPSRTIQVVPCNKSRRKPQLVKVVDQLLQKSKVKKNQRKQIANFWKEFCDNTAIVGLRFIAGRKRVNGIHRLIWIVIWLCQFSLCIWLSSNLFLRYFQYDIKTSTTYNLVEELPFPAVTICNQNTFRKSMVGGIFPIMYAMASFFAKNALLLKDMAEENNKTCYEKPDPKRGEQILTAYGDGFMPAMKLIATDSRSDVVQCWWQNAETNCSGIFLNHATDYSLCYTFNSDQMITVDTDKNLNFDGYGLDEDRYEKRKVFTAGPKSGLTLILNACQQDYCGSARKYNGAGFYIQVHDPRMQPSFLTMKSVLIAPGFIYDVSLKPVVFQRRTEHLGKCLNSLYLKMYPHNKVYFQMACFMECLTKMVLSTCKCFPFNLFGQEPMLAEAFRRKIEQVKICQGDEVVCMRNVLEDGLNQNEQIVCPKCKVPCYETFYENELSKKQFPTTHTLSSLLDQRGTVRNNSIRNNYLKINFYFDSMNVLIVEESQAFTFRNLAIAFGWTMSLFLGSSFVTPFEIMYYIMLSFAVLVKKFKALKQVNSYV